MARFLKKSGVLLLDSKKINDIFLVLNHNGTKEDVIENFKFHFGENSLNIPLRLPNHQKYLHFKTNYSSFEELYKYFNANQKDNYLLPFLGEDLL